MPTGWLGVLVGGVAAGWLASDKGDYQGRCWAGGYALVFLPEASPHVCDVISAQLRSDDPEPVGWWSACTGVTAEAGPPISAERGREAGSHDGRRVAVAQGVPANVVVHA
jgi:hypothetical protein